MSDSRIIQKHVRTAAQGRDAWDRGAVLDGSGCG